MFIEVVLTSCLTLRSYLCFVLSINCATTLFRFQSRTPKLCFPFDFVNHVDVFTDMIQGSCVVRTSRRVDTLGFVPVISNSSLISLRFQ